MTKTDLFNKALRLIGHDRTIAEGATTSVEYLRCQSEWDGARVAVLSYHPWSWCLQETPITEGAEATDDVTNRIEYTYDRPDCIRIAAVMDVNRKKIPYRCIAGTIYADKDETIIQYIEDAVVVDDLPDEWPQVAIDAMAAELAARISPSMSKNGAAFASMQKMAMRYLLNAVNLDSQEHCTSGSAGRIVASRR